MDEERMDELAGDPRFIPGIYNYCDRWCERCGFTARCLNYAMGQEMEAEASRSRDHENEAFWDQLHETFESTMETSEDPGEEMDFDLDEEEIHEAAQAQPCSRIAMKYIEVVDQWLQTNAGLFDDEDNVLEPPAGAEHADPEPIPGAASLQDCLAVIRWYQRQIYIKLCRAATGMIRGELEGNEYDPQDANGSAKVALLGIERSIAAWAILRRRFPDHEDAILALGTLQRLWRQVETAFPDARAFRRPGFDTDENQMEG